MRSPDRTTTASPDPRVATHGAAFPARPLHRCLSRLPSSHSSILSPPPGRAGRCRPRKSGKESTRLIKLVGMASSMSSGAGTSALRFWASRFLRRQESHVGALSALGARGYKTTTGIVGVEVDPEAPETLRHLLKKILRVSLEEVRTARRGRGWGGAREGGRPFQPFPSARDASSRAWPRGSRRESGKKT